MFKKGQLVIVDTIKFYDIYYSNLAFSIPNINAFLKKWIRNINKYTNKTKIVKIEDIGPTYAVVRTLNKECTWWIMLDVLVPFGEKRFMI